MIDEILNPSKSLLSEEAQRMARELFQEIIDDLLKNPQYKQYVQQRKLGLLNSEWAIIDELLRTGVLKG